MNILQTLFNLIYFHSNLNFQIQYIFKIQRLSGAIFDVIICLWTNLQQCIGIEIHEVSMLTNNEASSRPNMSINTLS